MTITRFASLLLTVSLVSARVLAHDEPPKTLQERLEKEKQRKKIVAAHVQRETVWRVRDGQRRRQMVIEYDRLGHAVRQLSYSDSDEPSLEVLSRYTPEHVEFERLVISHGDTERTAFTYLAPRIIAAATDYTPSGHVIGRLTYTYTDTLITAAKRDSLDAPAYTIFYRYPQGVENGKMEEALQVDAAGEQMIRVRLRYADGRPLEKKVFGYRDTLQSVVEFEFNPNGEVQRQTGKRADGTVSSIRLYSYDDNRLPSTILETDAEGTLKSSLQFTYETYGP